MCIRDRASVDENGRVTLKGAGTILIYAKGEGQRLGTLSLTVYAANIVEPQAIKLNMTEANILVGKTLKLSVSFVPSNTDKMCIRDSIKGIQSER